MKIILISLLFVLFVNMLFPAEAGTEGIINLKEGWKFIEGDNPANATLQLDDSKWVPIRVDKVWEEQGYEKLDGFAWFRIKFVLPSSLKENSYLKEEVRIFLGKINNFDQSYLNGSIFGINGETVPSGTLIDKGYTNADMQLYNKERCYVLSVDDPRLLWDKENVIAVRVFDEGGLGGLYTGDACIRMVKFGDYLAIDKVSNPFLYKSDDVVKIYTLENNSKKYTLNGMFTMEAITKVSKWVVFKKVMPLSLAPGTSREFPLVLGKLDQACRINCGFEFSETSEIVSKQEESPYILTPQVPDKPRINGAKVVGVRPGKPFLFSIPVTGIRPMTYEMILDKKNSPRELILDKQTGIITGSIQNRGEYTVTLIARNSKGETQRKLKIVVGDTLALTPPMGWNSWNCWGLSVDENKILASARVFKEKGLLDHGWSYINIDDGWEIKGDSPLEKRDNVGNIITNEKFKNMKSLGDGIHALGLKFGIYSSPGPLTCGGYTASYGYEVNDAQSFAQWGIDYLKYDWCSYEKIAKDQSRGELMKPYTVMRNALENVDRDIVYSLCQYGMGNVWEWGAEVGGNLWRTTGDITDTWESMSEIGFNQIENARYAGPGHWNDPDMLVIGWVGWGPNLHPTRLTPDEQYTHISLWCLLSSPLLIGCDLERLDPFYLNLLTNDEVLAINQDPLGKQATPVIKTGNIQVWVKELEDGNKAVGIFNLGADTESYVLDITGLGFAGNLTVRDLWRQQNISSLKGSIKFAIPSHGVQLIKIIR